MTLHRGSRGTAAIVYWDTGFGIRRDAQLIESVLREFGLKVGHWKIQDSRSLTERRMAFARKAWRVIRPMALQVHLEQVHREKFRFAKNNLIFPNPERFDPNVLGKLAKGTILCCKTRHAKELFKPHAIDARYLGFTSVDRADEKLPKDYRKFLHLAGKSDWKGTKEIVELWRANPAFPELTIVWSDVDSYGNPREMLQGASNLKIIHGRLKDREVTELINANGIHLCPSQTEGYGHYIVEALSASSVVVTTDGPPMNELVQSHFGYRVRAETDGTIGMSELYRVQVPSLEIVIREILNTPTSELRQKGKQARSWYENNDHDFRGRLVDLLRELLKTSAKNPRPS